MANAITRDPETMHGVPVFRGTRVPVQTLFDYLEGGDTLEDFLSGFPTVSRALALEALEFAQFEAAGWREMLNDALRQTGGPLTEGERKWADELLRPPGSNAV